MQGIAHYSNSPSPPGHHHEAGPSRLRDDGLADVSQHSPDGPARRKRPRRASPLPENLTHTSQSALLDSELANEPVSVAEEAAEASATAGADGTSGASTEEDLFRRATRPPPIDGVEDWGIPPGEDPAQCDPKLTAKIANFLDLKYARDQHINTSLLSSSAFANPHIYSKLVEFVDLSERATAFPGGGWLTRNGLEEVIPLYGPKAMGEEQKRRQEETRRAQEVGKRKAIDFAPAKRRDDERRPRDRGAVHGIRSASSRDGARNQDAGRARYRESGITGRDRRDKDTDRDRDNGRPSGRESESYGDPGRDRVRHDSRHDHDRDAGWEERDMNRDKRHWNRSRR